MKKLLVSILVMLVAGTAFAQIDPDPNMMGIYSDPGADADSWFYANFPSFMPTDVYLVLTMPTSATVEGFECELTYGGTAGYTHMGTTFNAENAINVGDNTNILVGYGAPVPTTDATLLATFSIMKMDATADGDIELYLGPSVPSSNNMGLPSVLYPDGEIATCGYHLNTIVRDGRDVQLIAALVGPGSESVPGDFNVVATEDATFDSVKSLYR